MTIGLDKLKKRPARETKPYSHSGGDNKMNCYDVKTFHF